MKKFLIILFVITGCITAKSQTGENNSNWKSQANKLLLKAAAHGRTKNVINLLNRGADINAKSEFGNTAYNYAVRNCFDKTAYVLKLNGADTTIKFINNNHDNLIIPFDDTTSYDGYDINQDLLYQVYNNNIDSVLLLLKQGANPNANDEYEDITALMYAINADNLKAVKILINAGATPNYKPYYNTPPFIEAVLRNNIEIIKFLLRKGALVNQVDEYGATALHYASGLGYFNTVKLLVANGAVINKKSTDGNTPLDLATITNNQEIVQYLIEKGANINNTDKQKNTPFITAAEYNYPELLDLFIDKKVNYKTVNNYGYDAFTVSLRNGFLENAEKIFKVDSAYFLKTEDSKILFKNAFLSENRKQVKWLKSLGYKTNILPSYNKIFFAYGFITSFDDIMFNTSFGIKDFKYNSLISLSYATRYWYKRVLFPIGENSYYQYWEKRHILSIDADKRFILANDLTQQFGLSAGVKTAFTFGKYRGVKQKINKQIIVSPKVGIFYNTANFSTQLSYEYLKYKIEGISPHNIELMLLFYIDINKADSGSYFKKTIEWF